MSSEFGGTEAFPNLGRHCSAESCGLLDFLPFKCDACSKIFCSEHRTYTSHHCPNGSIKDTSVLLCPLCTKSVRNVFGKSSDATLTSHYKTDCKPIDLASKRKSRCPVKGCSQTLTFSNRVTCRDCKHEYCLRHRFASEHRCSSLDVTVQRGKFNFNASRSSNEDFSMRCAASSGMGKAHDLVRTKPNIVQNETNKQTTSRTLKVH